MEKVGIEINLIGDKQAEKTLENIENSTRRLGAKKTMIQMEDGSLISVEERIKQIQDRLAVLKSQKKLKLLDANQKREMSRLNAELDILNRGLKNGTANAKTFKQVFNSISSQVAHAGSAMQSMGNALTRVGSFMRPITTGLLMGAGYKALNLFTEGFSNAFERADTMRNFDRSLGALGLDVKKTFKLMSDEALTARDNLDLAVQGLPTSLDEIMAAQKVYAGATGEMVSSTKTAIAANNAFLASTTDSRQQRVLQRYFVALASGANLTAMQWAAMQRNMPLAFRKVGEAMGYMDVKQLQADLTNGTASAQEFLKTFQKLGTTGVIRDAAMVMTKSWAGLFSNIRIATARMGEGILKTLNETFEKATDRDLLSHLLGIDAKGQRTYDGIRDWINGISKSVQNWIKANPDRIIEFFETLKSIDFKGLLKGMAEGLGDIAGIIESLAKMASDKDMSKVGRFLAKAGFYGRALTIFGGVIKGLRHPLAGIGTIGTWLLGKASGGGIFGKIASFFGSKKSIQTAGDAAKTIPSVADTFKGAFNALSGLIKASGAILLVSGTGFVAFKSVKSMMKDLKEIGNILKDMTWLDAVNGAAIVTGIATFAKIFQAFGDALGPQGLLGVAIASAASFLVTGAFAADMWAIKTGVKQIHDTIIELDNVASAITNMKGIGTLNPNIKEKFRTTIDAINEIKNMFVGKNGSPIDRGQVEAGLPTFSTGKVTALTNIANAIKQMQKIVEQFNALSVMTVSDPSEVIEDIKNACIQLKGIKAPRNILKQSTRLADALIQIRRMAYHINKLAGTSVDADGFASFVQQIKDALAELKKLNQTMKLDIKVVLGDGFRTSVNGVVKQINNGRTRIKKALDKYPTTVTKHISVTITASVNTASAIKTITDGASAVTNVANSVSAHPATGGLIYRAKGGSIFKRRGTDTVPAMLTPGEYVHNKRAVNAFGIDFMRKVNNLDMRGAMNELMHRAGSMANINRSSNITNNYNNNQKVVINNNGNAGAGYTFKSASRFVGAF